MVLIRRSFIQQRNSERVLKALPDCKYKKAFQDLEIDAERVEKNFGVIWKIQDDKFVFTNNMKVFSFIKQGILSVNGLTPFTVKVKLLIQLMWRKNLEWDDEVSQDIAKA